MDKNQNKRCRPIQVSRIIHLFKFVSKVVRNPTFWLIFSLVVIRMVCVRLRCSYSCLNMMSSASVATQIGHWLPVWFKLLCPIYTLSIYNPNEHRFDVSKRAEHFFCRFSETSTVIDGNEKCLVYGQKPKQTLQTDPSESENSFFYVCLQSCSKSNILTHIFTGSNSDGLRSFAILMLVLEHDVQCQYCHTNRALVASLI